MFIGLQPIQQSAVQVAPLVDAADDAAEDVERHLKLVAGAVRLLGNGPAAAVSVLHQVQQLQPVVSVLQRGPVVPHVGPGEAAAQEVPELGLQGRQAVGLGGAGELVDEALDERGIPGRVVHLFDELGLADGDGDGKRRRHDLDTVFVFAVVVIGRDVADDQADDSRRGRGRVDVLLVQVAHCTHGRLAELDQQLIPACRAQSSIPDDQHDNQEVEEICVICGVVQWTTVLDRTTLRRAIHGVWRLVSWDIC
ncbi:hypothetical protein B0T24DRAFT_644315 [Lasiosphaeria ovina]|uniref:Uncharacterized protein n=1 Tax=Lasiosphaeria ovina TaxID=92902 RepID=A0AAE0JRL5_9PEZI|nr:hypothetical protein B0T24DRAFT_644315 [Lasiosphaeria ovina]